MFLCTEVLSKKTENLIEVKKEIETLVSRLLNHTTFLSSQFSSSSYRGLWSKYKSLNHESGDY